MMRVAFITRSTLYDVYGGDTVQIISTANYIRKLGISVDILLCNEVIPYQEYDLLHFFNITRPADLIFHMKRCKKPYVVSTIFVDYSQYEKTNRDGIRSVMGRIFSSDSLEYIKAWARWIKNGEIIKSWDYIFQGHRKSVQRVAARASLLLPNSESEYRRFVEKYQAPANYRTVYNAVDPEAFPITESQSHAPRDPKLVICVSRIEGRKNQLNLIRALNNTVFQLAIIGKPAPNQLAYFQECQKAAAKNIRFIDFMQQPDLVSYYLSAKVHVLPSWNETCGLSSLEAAYAGCNVVITDKGDTREYFSDYAWYCDPGSPESIYQAICLAAEAPVRDELRKKIVSEYNWAETARKTATAYEEVIGTNLY